METWGVLEAPWTETTWEAAVVFVSSGIECCVNIISALSTTWAEYNILVWYTRQWSRTLSQMTQLQSVNFFFLHAQFFMKALEKTSQSKLTPSSLLVCTDRFSEFWSFMFSIWRSDRTNPDVAFTQWFTVSWKRKHFPHSVWEKQQSLEIAFNSSFPFILCNMSQAKKFLFMNWAYTATGPSKIKFVKPQWIRYFLWGANSSISS